MLGNNHQRWAPENDHQLRALFNQRLSLGRIASRLGRSTVSVTRRAKLLGLPVPTHNQRRKALGLAGPFYAFRGAGKAARGSG
jgi:hypothetical protein